MRTNWETALVGRRAVLVPYRRKFVHRYHEWMKDPFLQEMTASEPLSLEEEYAMQASWRDDPKKCTFIVLDAALPGAGAFETRAMAGDVNLFLNDADGDLTIAEIEVMVAEVGSRRKGLGREAVCMMMAYGAEALGLTRFYCKINEANAPSIAMFEGLGYVRVNYVAAFKEIEFEFRVPPKPEAEAGAEAGTEAWRDKWRRLIVGGEGGEAVLMRRAPYRESGGEEEGEGEGEGGTGEEEG